MHKSNPTQHGKPRPFPKTSRNFPFLATAILRLAAIACSAVTYRFRCRKVLRGAGIELFPPPSVQEGHMGKSPLLEAL